METDKKENDRQLREEVLADDETKDVGVCLSVTTATFAVLTTMCGAGAVIALRALARFRPDIGAYWMACLPYIFPAITGIGVAFKRERTAVSLHVVTTIVALLCGGSSYGYSVEPVFINNANCTDIYTIGACDRPPLLYMYLVGGAAASVFCLFGVILAFCACASASKRRAQRSHDAEVLLYQEEARSRLQVIHTRNANSTHQAPVVTIPEKIPNGNDITATNGISQSTQAVIDNLSTRL